MKPEDIVVSLEMAKKLKEAGWGKPTVFSYYKQWIDGEPNTIETIIATEERIDSDDARIFNSELLCYAPTFQEIWEGLRGLKVDIHRLHGFPQAGIGLDIAFFEHGRKLEKEFSTPDGNICDEAAKAWIWCKENNYIT